MGEERESERGKRGREGGFPGRLVFSFQVSHTRRAKNRHPFEIPYRPPNHRTYVLSRVIANGSMCLLSLINHALSYYN